MANRPCKPDNDMKRLWRTLLPGMPLPACGVTDEAAVKADDRDGDKDRPERTPR